MYRVGGFWRSAAVDLPAFFFRSGDPMRFGEFIFFPSWILSALKHQLSYWQAMPCSKGVFLLFKFAVKADRRLLCLVCSVV